MLQAAQAFQIAEKTLVCPLRAPGTGVVASNRHPAATAVALLNVQPKTANSTRADLLLPGYGRPVPVWTDLPGADP